MVSILHSVSGDLICLHRYMSGEKGVAYTPAEDDMISKNPEFLRNYKGQDSVEKRKEYLAFKVK